LRRGIGRHGPRCFGKRRSVARCPDRHAPESELARHHAYTRRDGDPELARRNAHALPDARTDATMEPDAASFIDSAHNADAAADRHTALDADAAAYVDAVFGQRCTI
jgi:hypothetical protein